jgi:hypothetical protein
MHVYARRMEIFCRLLLQSMNCSSKCRLCRIRVQRENLRMYRNLLHCGNSCAPKNRWDKGIRMCMRRFVHLSSTASRTVFIFSSTPFLFNTSDPKSVCFFRCHDAASTTWSTGDLVSGLAPWLRDFLTVPPLPLRVFFDEVGLR